MKIFIWFFAVAIIFGSANLARTQGPRDDGDDFYGRKYALVIGNGKYEKSPLKNPENDAADMAEVLRKTGFKVSLHVNADLAAMRLALAEFESKVPENGAAFIFYAGHGVQYQGQNYLIPIGALDKVKTAGDLPRHAFALSEITGQLASRRKGISVIVLDACRDSPFANLPGVESGLSRSTGLRGLKADDTPKAKKKAGGLEGVVIAYSTAPDATAADGDGRNSPYAKHLKELLRRPNTSLESVLKLTRVEVTRETKGQQTPWYETSINGEFYPAGRGRIEFEDLLRLFVPVQERKFEDDLLGLSWRSGSQPTSPIVWENATKTKDQLVLDNLRRTATPIRGTNLKLPDANRGKVKITVDGELTHDDFWSVALLGNYRPSYVIIEADYMAYQFQSGIGKALYLSKEPSCGYAVSSDIQVYKIDFPGHHQAWLAENRDCGSQICSAYYAIFFHTNDKKHFGCK